MSKILTSLLIDDLRSFKDGRITLIARNSEDALTILKHDSTQQYHEIWLDHDLGLTPKGEKDTIMPIVDYLCEKAFNGDAVLVDTIYIHTSNPVGAKQMITSLSRYGYRTVRVDPTMFFIVETD